MSYAVDSLLTWVWAQIVNLLDGLVQVFLSSFSLNIGQYNAGASGIVEQGQWLTGDNMLTALTTALMQYKSVITSIAIVIATLLFLLQLYRLFFMPVIGTKAESPVLIFGRYLCTCIFVAISPYALDLLLGAADRILQAVATIQIVDSVEISGFLGGFGAIVGTAESLAKITLAPGVLLFQIILFIPIIFEYVKLLLEIIERWVIMILLYCTAPLPISTFASGSTANVFRAWTRMISSQVILIFFNVIFLRVADAILMVPPHDSAFASWLFFAFLVISWLKVGQSMDQYLATVGLSTAQAGANVMSSIGGALHSVTNIARLGKDVPNIIKNPKSIFSSSMPKAPGPGDGARAGARTPGSSGRTSSVGLDGKPLKNGAAPVTTSTRSIGCNGMPLKTTLDRMADAAPQNGALPDEFVMTGLNARNACVEAGIPFAGSPQLDPVLSKTEFRNGVATVGFKDGSGITVSRTGIVGGKELLPGERGFYYTDSGGREWAVQVTGPNQDSPILPLENIITDPNGSIGTLCELSRADPYPERIGSIAEQEAYGLQTLRHDLFAGGVGEDHVMCAHGHGVLSVNDEAHQCVTFYSPIGYGRFTNEDCVASFGGAQWSVVEMSYADIDKQDPKGMSLGGTSEERAKAFETLYPGVASQLNWTVQDAEYVRPTARSDGNPVFSGYCAVKEDGQERYIVPVKGFEPQGDLCPPMVTSDIGETYYVVSASDVGMPSIIDATSDPAAVPADQHYASFERAFESKTIPTPSLIQSNRIETAPDSAASDDVYSVLNEKYDQATTGLRMHVTQRADSILHRITGSDDSPLLHRPASSRILDIAKDRSNRKKK